MIPEKLPTYSVQQLEQIASQVLRERFDDRIPIPIDVDFLVETTERVDLDFWPGLRANHSIDGAVFLDTNAGALFVYIDDHLADADHLRNRYRMTVAEEFGHIILHRDIMTGITSVEDFRQLQLHPQWYEAERNAKRFAAAVLMPGNTILEHANEFYRVLVDAAGYGNVEVIKKYLRNQLADRFEVSPESMGFRLNEWPMRVYKKVDEAMQAKLNYLS